MGKILKKDSIKDLYDLNSYKIVLDFDGTLLSTEKYFEKYRGMIRIVNLFYSAYSSKFENYIDYRKVRKFFGFLTKVISKKICKEYLKKEDMKEIRLLLNSLRNTKNKNLEIFILSRSKTAECLGLSKSFFPDVKIPYFWVGIYKKTYLDVICKEKNCLLISDNEDEDIIRDPRNVLFLRVKSPIETYEVLNKILYSV